MASLGQGDYTASIVFSSSPTTTIAVMPFSEIKWQRVNNKTSSASLVVPGADGGIECCGVFGGLRPWDHMLVVERNGYVVWDGPIIGWTRDPSGDLTIRALDRSSLFSKTLVGKTQLFPAGSALETILRGLFTNGFVGPTPFSLTIDYDWGTYFTPAPPGEVDLHVERLDYLESVLSQLAQSTDLYWTCRSDLVQFCEYKLRSGLTAEGLTGVHLPGFDNRWPALSESVVTELPTVAVDGTNLATVVYLGGASSGANGHAVVDIVDLRSAIWYVDNGDPPPYILSSLQDGQGNLTQSDTTSVTTAAEQRAVAVSTPNLTVEQIHLAPNFGGQTLLPSLDNLMPGCRFLLDFQETCAFNVPTSKRVYTYDTVSGQYDFTLAWAGDTRHVRLDQLDVTVDDNGEEVVASFTPTVEVLSGLVTFTDLDNNSRSVRAVY